MQSPLGNALIRLAVLFVLLAFSATLKSSLLSILVAIAALVTFLEVLFRIGRSVWRELAGTSASYEDDEEDEDELDPQVIPKEVARRAVERAKVKESDWVLSLEDIGILAYHGDDSPDVVRMNPIVADVSHVRPFAVIDLPYREGKGTIHFELLDAANIRRFEATEPYALAYGANFITTRSYLPLPDDRKDGYWTLRININGEPFAEHDFIVRAQSANVPMRAILAEDGEIDAWLAHAITEGRQGGNLSLDDLLDMQSDARQAESRLH